ncbi:MAG: polysaccharide export protein [Planctomycetes bacterium]|nr:polysaccharide export protein [Planctomycetota bacterium]
MRTVPLLVAIAAASLVGCASSSATRYRPGAPVAGAAPVAAPGPVAAPTAVAAPAEGPARPVARVRYRFDVGDEIAVAVWKEPELATQQRILADGTISPPLLRPTTVVGLTVEELQSRLTKDYAEYLVEPKVSVRVVSIHADRVFVLGEVKDPQAVTLTGPTTLLAAVAQAGGFVEEAADKTSVLIIRKGADGRPEATAVNLKAILAGHDVDASLQRGDIVFVPARGVTEWARTVGQALSPLSTALGTASSVAALMVAGN